VVLCEPRGNQLQLHLNILHDIFKSAPAEAAVATQIRPLF
jgi:hypothetical protein